MPMKNPPHPGEFIRTEIIKPAGLSVTAAAAALQVSRPALSSLLNGKADLSGDMALRIEKAFGVKMDTLMRMQASYDIAQIITQQPTTQTEPADVRSTSLPRHQILLLLRAGPVCYHGVGQKLQSLAHYRRAWNSSSAIKYTFLKMRCRLPFATG